MQSLDRRRAECGMWGLSSLVGSEVWEVTFPTAFWWV